jgi:hypothetical protein
MIHSRGLELKLKTYHIGSTILIFTLLMLGASQIATSQSGLLVINSLDPLKGGKGQLVRVLGGPFDRLNVDVKFDGVSQETTYRSSSELWFVTPDTTSCGAHSVMVRSRVELPGVGMTPMDSNPVIYTAICKGAATPSRSKPTIRDYSIRHIGGGNYEIVVEGNNFLPTSDEYPRTVIEMKRTTATGFAARGFATELRRFGEVISTAGSFICSENFELRVYNQHGSGFAPGLKEYSNEMESISITSNCTPSQEEEQTAELVLHSLNVPSEVQVGEEYSIIFTIQNSGSGASDPIDFSVYAGSDEVSSIPDLVLARDANFLFLERHTFSNTGEYTLQINAGPVSESRQITVVSGAVTQPPPDEELPPPPPVIGGNLSDYDQDNDCKLSDGEFFNMIDAWISESIENLLFFSGVDAWIGQTNICASSAGHSISLRVIPQGVLISSAANFEIGPFSIYDMNGRPLFQSYTSGTNLFWNMRSEFGDRVANGVYFVRFGNMGELRKFVVMR